MGSKTKNHWQQTLCCRGKTTKHKKPIDNYIGNYAINSLDTILSNYDGCGIIEFLLYGGEEMTCEHKTLQAIRLNDKFLLITCCQCGMDWNNVLLKT